MPIIVLVILLSLNIGIFGSDSILGASQVALLFSAGICVWLAMWLFKKPWKEFEEAIMSVIYPRTIVAAGMSLPFLSIL